MTADPSSTLPKPEAHRERPIPQVRGTRDWMPDDFAALAALERSLMDHFASAGFQAIRTPILEVTELHERKSGASIVSKLFELADGPGRLCLRPELTASVVRAFIDSAQPPPLPWRVCSSGPVFRFEREPGPTRYREFTQAGVELLGIPGPEGDAEVIALAVEAAKALGLTNVTIRAGHTGLIVEVLERCGLPSAAVSSLVEHLSDAASEGRNVRSLETALERLSGWLQGEAEQEAESVLPAIDQADDPGVDRLFRHLVPRVTGRRTGHEIIGRLRKKWALGYSLGATLERVRDRVHALSELRGPAVEVLQGLEQGYAALAPGTIRNFYEMLSLLESRGILPEQIRVLGSDRDPHGVGFAFGVERLYHALEARTR